MDTRRHLTDECRTLLLRAGEFAAQRGSQITSEDLLAAMAESSTSGATALLNAAVDAAVDPVEVKAGILSAYSEIFPVVEPLEVPL